MVADVSKQSDWACEDEDSKSFIKNKPLVLSNPNYVETPEVVLDWTSQTRIEEFQLTKPGWYKIEAQNVTDGSGTMRGSWGTYTLYTGVRIGAGNIVTDDIRTLNSPRVRWLNQVYVEQNISNGVSSLTVPPLFFNGDESLIMAMWKLATTSSGEEGITAQFRILRFKDK